MPLTTCLWFDDDAEAAAHFYAELFEDGKVGAVTPYPDGTPGAPGSVMTVEFEIMGQQFVGVNGGPEFPQTEAVSFQIPCDTQEQIDYYWERITAGGGEESQCGWCKDKFGVSWQVVYTQLIEHFRNPRTAAAVQEVMLQMQKLDVAAVDEAAAAALAGDGPRPLSRHINNREVQRDITLS
ncbi:VOC family protein [Micrococcales bacterium 31B]|nr:VOC family protein [Micrococcales bacterium 31B]